MNHVKHWTADPELMVRPGDTRLQRIRVYKVPIAQAQNPWEFGHLGAKRRWTVEVQYRNSTTQTWRSFEVFHYSLFEQAHAFVQLLLKAA